MIFNCKGDAETFLTDRVITRDVPASHINLMMQCREKHSKSFYCHFPLREGGGLNNSGISHKHIFMIPFRFGKHLDKGAINTFYSGTFQKYHICYSR